VSRLTLDESRLPSGYGLLEAAAPEPNGDGPKEPGEVAVAPSEPGELAHPVSAVSKDEFDNMKGPENAG